MISVIIPTLNEEKCIKNTLKSLKNQSFKGNFEIIVVDGGSIDNTVEIAKKYANNVIISKKKSPSVQRNLGAKVAKGNILAFLDADTSASKYWLESIVKTLQNKNIVCMTGPLLPLESIKRGYFYNVTNFLQKFLIKINYPLFWGASCAFKKDAFGKIKGFDENLFTSEDHDISLRVRKIGKVAFNENMLAFTSHRRFLENEKKASLLYIKDILVYFFYRKIEKYSVSLKDYKPNLRIDLFEKTLNR